MSRVKLFSVLLLASLCFPAALTAQTQTKDDPAANLPPVALNERILNVPGDPQRPVTLQVTLYTPNGKSPFPLVVFNHGASHKRTDVRNPDERFRFTFPALYFLSRGYAVALPMMRGFAGSGGTMEVDGCDLKTMGTNNAKDIEAVIGYFKSQPYIDGRKVLVSGQSYGGLNALHVGALNDADVKGIISFSAGMRSSSCTKQDEALVADFAATGSASRIPTLMFYGENDILFSTALWHQMFDAYVKAGGKAELVDYGRFLNDSHQLLSYREGLPLWTQKTDEFLTSVGLPGKMIYPEYLPTEPPPPSHFAAVDNVQAVPFLTPQARDVYRKYIEQKVHKAVVITLNGSIYVAVAGFDPQARAMKECTGHQPQGQCMLYAVDDNVVWIKR